MTNVIGTLGGPGSSLFRSIFRTYRAAFPTVVVHPVLEPGDRLDEPLNLIVVASRDPGHPNWLSTAGHQRGLLWFRWFHPAATPERPRTRVVPVDEVT